MKKKLAKEEPQEVSTEINDVQSKPEMVHEREFTFVKREGPDAEPITMAVKESMLDADQLEATFAYLVNTFNNSPYLTQARFTDELLAQLQKTVETEIVTAPKDIVGVDGTPLKIVE